MTDERPPEPKTPRGIEPRLRKDRNGGYVWRYRVRWQDPATGKRNVEELDTVREALDFLAQLRLAKRRGDLIDLDRGSELLKDFVAEWWEAYAKNNLAISTRKTYATVWNRHGLDRVGHLELRQVTPAVVARLRQDLETDGVGVEAIRKLMTMMQAAFREALIWDRLPPNARNPVQLVRKPTSRRKLAIVAFSTTRVEALRNAVRPGDDTSVLLITLLAYEGLRPEEALALEERHVGKATLLIEQKNVDGEIEPGQKTNKPPRFPDLFTPVLEDIRAFVDRRPVLPDAQGRRLLIRRPDGEAWTETDYRNWRTRSFQTAAASAGLAKLERRAITKTVDGTTRRRVRSRYDGPRPYDLRHTAASLLLRDPNYTLPEVAAFLGHDIATLSKHYAHIIAELKGEPPMAVGDAIVAARGKTPPERPRERVQTREQGRLFE